MTSICLVNMPFEYYSPTAGGAVSTVIREVAGSLERQGHRAEIVSYALAHEPDSRLLSLGDFRRRSVLTRAAGRARRQSPADRYRADVEGALLRAQPADVVITFNDYSSPRWLRPLVPCSRLAVWLHNDQPVPDHVDWDCIDVIVTCSDYIRREAVRRGAPAERIHVALNGVDLEQFVPRADWLSPPAELRVLAMGRLDPNKGFDTGVAAVQRLQAEADVTMSLAGARWWYGNDVDAYGSKLIADLEAIGGEYLGLVDRAHVAQVVAAHDVCLVLSRSQEPFGLVVLEAMAAGVAVVASTRGGLPEACGGAALALVEPDDVEAVIEALRSVTPPHTTALSAAKSRSRERAEHASWDVTCRSLLAAVTSA